MVLYLEADTCESGADIDYVTDVAFDCYQSGKYTSDESEYNFICPTCESLFDSMGALLQHIESDYCNEDMTDKRTALCKFLRYLQSQVASL